MEDLFLENLEVVIIENKNKLTLKELNELYGEDYIPPFFVKNFGGRIYPFSLFWKQKLIQLDNYIGLEIEKRKKETLKYSEGCSRTWRNAQKRHDKLISRGIFGEQNDK